MLIQIHVFKNEFYERKIKAVPFVECDRIERYLQKHYNNCKNKNANRKHTVQYNLYMTSSTNVMT